MLRFIVEINITLRNENMKSNNPIDKSLNYFTLLKSPYFKLDSVVTQGIAANQACELSNTAEKST